MKHGEQTHYGVCWAGLFGNLQNFRLPFAIVSFATHHDSFADSQQRFLGHHNLLKR